MTGLSSDQVAFYRDEGRLASEHALLDDNGDRKGSSYEMVRGRASAKGGEAIDGKLASRISIAFDESRPSLSDEQLRQRNQLETQLEEIKTQHAEDQTELRRRVLPVLRQIAEIYAQADATNDKESTSE